MGRLVKIRSLRPEFFADPKMVELTAQARILYMGLWCYVDDEGRGEFLPKRIEGDVFPLEDIDFWDLWAELEAIGRVVRYEAAGHEYFHIPTLMDWQNPNRKYASKLPEPPPHSNGAHPTHSADTARVPLGEVEGEVEGEGAAARATFDAFHADRAAAEVKRRQFEGLPVKNPGGLKHTIRADTEFLTESRRLWAHRDCSSCKGKGHTEEYSPGAGMRKVECEAADVREGT